MVYISTQHDAPKKFEVSAKSQLSKIAENWPKMVSNDEMVLIKVIRFEKTSIKMVSAKSQLSKIAENGPKMASNDEMVLMKVVRNGKTSLNIISA